MTHELQTDSIRFPPRIGAVEQASFHVERIMDLVSHSLPLCAVHQTRTLIFFCYVFVGILEFLLYPPYSTDSATFTLGTLFTPLLFVVVFHVILTVCYVFAALFERASCVTGFRLLYLLHGPLGFVFLVGSLIVLSRDSPDSFAFDFSVILTVGFFVDFCCGFVSGRTNIVSLSLELIGLFPGGILASLYFKGVISSAWLPFVPPFVYFGIYFGILLFLVPQCELRRECLVQFLADPEIRAEIEWAYTTGSGKNRDEMGKEREKPSKRSHRTMSSEYMDVTTQAEQQNTRFPANAEWQLYNLPTQPSSPIYLASPLPILMFAVFLGICLVHVMSPICDFYFWAGGAVLLVVIAILLNSRATACAFLAITNLDERCTNVMWDHPSLSVL
jgi:hypothetical protein